jgi:pimeloyl-ACP methyl ester carboxylesterase
MLRPPVFRPATLRNPRAARQLHHSNTEAQSLVELSSLVASPVNQPTTGSLVILHGLLWAHLAIILNLVGWTSIFKSGSKRNWTSFHKAFHRALPRHAIHTLDLRNHGKSPRATPMTYTSMAEDVLDYINSRGLSNVALLGHSMFVSKHRFKIPSVYFWPCRGGKVAMTVALLLAAKGREDILSHLLVSDVAPIRSTLSPDFIKYTEAMHEINSLPLGVIHTRSDVDTCLRRYEIVRILDFWCPQVY